MAAVFHHADAAQIPQYGTDGLRRAFLVYMRRFPGVSKMDQIVVDLGLSVHERWELHKNHIAPLPGNDGASVSAS